MRDALDQLGWDPPRIMGTSFMFYLMGFDKFEGWVGIDQFHPDNPLVPDGEVAGLPAPPAVKAGILDVAPQQCGSSQSAVRQRQPNTCVRPARTADGPLRD